MATVNLRPGGSNAGDGVKLPSTNHGQLKKLVSIIDFAETSRAQNDVLQLFDIPAGTFVQAVKCQVITAEDSTATADIGDADDVDGYLDGINLETVGHNCSAPGALAEGAPNTVAPAFGRGKFYSAAGIISMKVLNAVDAGKVKVEVFALQ